MSFKHLRAKTYCQPYVLLIFFLDKKLRGSRAAAPKETNSCRTQWESVRLSVRPSTSSPPLHPQGFVSFGTYSDPNSASWPKSKQYGPSLSKMAQIQSKWPKSKHNDPNPSKMAQVRLEYRCQRPKWWTLGQTWPLFLDLGNFAEIWGILLGFQPFCWNFSRIAWILAIWSDLGHSGPQRRYSPVDRVGG